MMDEKILLIEKLRDNADKFLLEKLSQDIGPLHDQYQKELGEKLYAWISWAVNYYSTTELHKIYRELCAKYPGIFYSIGSDDYKRLADLDECKYLELHDVKHMPPMKHLGFSNQASQHRVAGAQSYAIWKQGFYKAGTSHLNNMARQIRLSQDKRKMRRLKRKEAKLRKKGIRLFDSE